MDVFEYNEVRWPTRALQQEEEEDAIGTAVQYLHPPTIKWVDDCEQPAPAQLLVVGMSPASCALLEACLTAATAKLVATVQTPSKTQVAADDNTRTASASARSAEVSAVLYSADEHSRALVCCCSKGVPAEQAPAWARGLMQQLQPQRLLLLASMQVEQYRGEADPSQEFVAFLLQSSKARQCAAAQQVVPYLPSGSVVAGLPAALVSTAELHGVPADLLVVVDMVPALVPATLHELSSLMRKALQQASADSAGSISSWVQQLQLESVVEMARSKLQQGISRPTSVYS